MSSVPPPSLPSRPELPEGVHRPEPPAPPERTWERAVPLWSPFAVAFAAFILASVSYAVFVAIAGLSAAEAENAPGPLLGATFVQDAVLIGGAALAIHVAVRSDAVGALGIRPTRLGPALGWGLAVMVAYWISTGIVVSIFGKPPEQEITQEIKEETAALALAGYIGITCMLAPLAEEVFFRGFLFPVLRSRWGTAAGVIATGALFSLVHASGSPAEALIVLFVLGAGLCLLYLRTGSLLPCIGVHALNNAIAFAATKEMEWSVALLTVVGSVAVSVSIAMAFMRSRAPAQA
jgi:membrane protease YdiL (CAAX protease family)